MDSKVLESNFPCLPTTKKVSFKIHSGARESQAFAGFPASPVTPVFQSDFVHGILGAQQSVNDEISSLLSSGDSPFPLLESKQSALVSSARISASSNLCCEGMNSANSSCHRASSISDPDKLAHAGVLDLRVLEPDSGVDDLGRGHRQEFPDVGSSLHHENVEFALSPCGSGMQDASMVSPMEQNQESQNRTLPSSEAQLGLSEERGEEPKGRSWSSVVTKNTFGGNAIKEVDNSRRWLMLLSYIGDPFGSKRSQVLSLGASDAN